MQERWQDLRQHQESSGVGGVDALEAGWHQRLDDVFEAVWHQELEDVFEAGWHQEVDDVHDKPGDLAL